MLKTVMTQHNGVRNGLSATLESLFEHLLKGCKLRGINAHVTEAVLGNHDIIAPMAALVKSEQRKFAHKSATMEQRSPQDVKVRIRVLLVIVS